jgi:hypothetical protein
VSGSLVDAYIKALSELEEFAFPRAIVQRLLVVLNNFQSVPTYPQGDGGLDGHSHKGTKGYCCYGLKYDTAKTPQQRSKQIVKKFSSDLQRLYELEPKGKTKLIHKDNHALFSIFGAVPPPALRESATKRSSRTGLRAHHWGRLNRTEQYTPAVANADGSHRTRTSSSRGRRNSPTNTALTNPQ